MKGFPETSDNLLKIMDHYGTILKKEVELWLVQKSLYRQLVMIYLFCEQN